MSKAVKTIVAVAASIAIPFAAPIIAQSTALAGLTSTVGLTASSALVGAGLGAANAAVTGGDVGRGALMGGISGGVSGYMQPASSVPQSALTAANATADPIAALNASQGFTGVDQAYLAAITAADPIAVMNAQQGWTTSDPQYAGRAAQTPGLNTSGLSGAVVPTTPINPAAGLGAGAGTGTTGTGAGTGAAAPKTYAEALKARFTDPKTMADFTLRAAGQLAGSALAGDGLSSEEQALLAQQTDELRQLQQTNQGLFNQKLEAATSLIGDSRYFDPEYFGLQSARRAQTAGAVAKRAGLRGLTGERRASEGRRYDIESGRRTGTAYDVGFTSAISPRVQTMQAGLSAMPGYMAYQTPAVTAQLGAQGVARGRRQEDRDGIADLFGPLYK